jgi:Cu+-exporting ATPase
VKIINKFLFLLLAASIFVSCETSTDKNNQDSVSETPAAEADMRVVKIDIRGMTCEIGCAKLIQSKLYKTEGVNFAKVSFADSSGVVRYDANRLTEIDLRKTVEAAGGGDLYRVERIARMDRLDSLGTGPEITP